MSIGAALSFFGASAVQRYLPPANSFDVAFNRIGGALVIAGVVSAGIGAVMIRLGARQFALGERIGQSCLALILVAIACLIWLRAQ